ncbi:MAG: phosphatase PAP2 family protein [Candidatus Amulumruptor caecigallinarius]|nr:phosphatase PAP2 family protein [Candidatus Amulumruptor caecigallinarius]
MKIFLTLFLAICIGLSSSAQDIAFQQTSAQKGVETSTDILVMALPASALVGTLVAKDWKGLVQGVETAAATAAATLILKYSIKEWRPDHSNHHSFPSGHTAVSFATSAYLQRRYGWKFGAPAYALSCYVAWGRVFSKKHHWWDVLGGAAIGAGSAYIFTRPYARKHNLQISPVSDGHGIGIYASMEF